MTHEAHQPPRFIRVSGWHSIKTRIIVFAMLATIIPSVTLGLLSYVQNRKFLQDKIANALRSATAQTAGELELWLKARLYDLRVFCSSYVVSENLQRMLGHDRSTIEQLAATHLVRAYLQSVREKFADYRELVLISMIGDPLVATGTATPVVHLPEKWFEHMDSDGAIMGDPYWDPSLKRRVVTLAEVVKSSDNRRLGILAAKVDLAAVEAILQRRAIDGVDAVYITGRHGKLIASSVAPDATDNASADTRIPLAGHPLSAAPTEYTGFHHRTVVGMGAHVQASDWAVFAEMEKSNAYAGIDRLGTITLVLVAALLITMGALAYFLGQTIVRPLRRLSGEAGKVAAGNLDVDIPVRGSNEVSYLTQVFNHMVSSLRRGRAEIAEAQEALMEKNRELHRLSITDGLTGLFNRKHLMDRFDIELARTRRYRVPFAVMIADIDHFKAINDNYGHLAGDAVLKRTADTIKASVRECDIVGRYGGEEFLIILPNSEAVGAVEMAQRIREAVSQVRFNSENDEITVTISVGVAQCAVDGEEGGEAIISRADTALYQAKSGGRNQVIGP